MSRRLGRRSQDGQLTVLVLGFTAIALLLVVVVVVATRAYLTRRSLVSYADGAAVSAAQAVSEAGVYQQGIDGSVPLDAAAAARTVSDFVASNGLAAEFDGFQVVDVEVTRAGVVRVVLGAVSPVPFVNDATGRFAGGVPIEVESTAEALLG